MSAAEQACSAVREPRDTATWRCRAATDSGERCDYRSTRDELRDHAADAGHPRCVVCGDVLASHERQTCGRCADRVRDDLDAIETAYANLERAIGDAAYRGIAWTQLAMLNDGSTSGGGEDDHPRWHDPLPPAAVLDNLERDWRDEFGHGQPPYPVLGEPGRHAGAVVRDAIGYLRTWHTLAARTHPGFDDYAAELRTLRAQVEHAVGMADDPVVAPIWCSCADAADGNGGRLVRWFAPPADVHPGLADEWTCCSCGESMDEAAYLLRLRVLTELPGWVSMEAAAKASDRPLATVRAWAQSGHVPTACSRFTRRTVVELEAVTERSTAVGRVATRTA